MADEPKRKIPTAPTGLKVAGKRLWRQIWATYDLNPGEAAILERACRATDSAAVMQAELDTLDSLMAVGSMGQSVMHPFVAEIRQHEALAVQCLAKLKLPDDNSGDNKRNVQRDNVNARWANRGG